MKNLTKAQQKFIDRLLNSFEKEVIPWRATWDKTIVRPYNASTNMQYRGINLLNLYMTSLQAGYDDPRWMTFKQANDNGYRIKRGSVGTDIFFYSLKNMQTGELIEQEDYLKMDAEARENIRLVTKSYVVFNAKQIDGIPKIDIKKHSIQFKNDKAMEFVNKLSKNANLTIHHEGNQPHYNRSTDRVVVPNADAFIDERAYYATLLHECGHATMHESRLNRDVAAMFGTEKYAKEELRAELTSAFLTLDIGFNFDNSHEENHQAYIQHWKKVIKDEPKFIFQAIKDAQKIREYLLEKGDYEKIYRKEEKYFKIPYEQDKIKEAKNELENKESHAKLEINEFNFPDKIFREYIRENFDKDQDGILSNDELNHVTEITINVLYPLYSQLKSLKGIEYFPNLRSLLCDYTGITELDISQNIALERLNCHNTQLTSLDVSQNTALTYLHCSNTQITNLDVRNNTNLEFLACAQTKIKSLDISNNTQLKVLGCNNTKITNLCVDNKPALKFLNCGKTAITTLDVSKNTELEYLNCHETGITTLDISNNTELKRLDCLNTNITSLDVSKNINLVTIYNNTNTILIKEEKKESFIQEKNIKKAKEIAENKTPQQEIKQEKAEDDLTVMKNSVSIVEYARDVLGMGLVKESRGMFRLEEHDSCKIYPNNTFYRFSTGVGGSIIDFIKHFEECDIKTAIEKMKNYYHEYNPTAQYDHTKSKKIQPKIDGIFVPSQADTNKHVYAYLTKTRGINPSVVKEFINRKILYEDEHRNCVFVGKLDKIIYYANIRGTGRKSFKQDVEGSTKEVGIYIHNKSHTLVVNEAIIDTMSYMSLAPNPYQYNYLAVNGAANAVNAVRFHMLKREEAKDLKRIIIGLDNDLAGEENAMKLVDFLREHYPNIEALIHTPNAKDFNEQLQNELNILSEVAPEQEIKVDHEYTKYYTQAFIDISQHLYTIGGVGAQDFDALGYDTAIDNMYNSIEDFVSKNPKINNEIYEEVMEDVEYRPELENLKEMDLNTKVNIPAYREGLEDILKLFNSEDVTISSENAEKEFTENYNAILNEVKDNLNNVLYPQINSDRSMEENIEYSSALEI